ncbi:DUF1674 domain-containing protein [Candidatus Rariloculus sp.]|uniref:DUF1674 domain-containing protein n=1 Tax=Candidatus Rariloculus sp. TaxID=3101265 RepID=UPI003D09E622
MSDKREQQATEQHTEARAEAPATGSGERAERPTEIGGPRGPEPTRYGDWERGGRCIDF